VEEARVATRADLPRLVELAREGAAELTPTRGGAIWARREARPEPVEESLGAALDDPEQLVLVGTIDGTIIGYAAVRLDELHDGERLAVLTELFVDPGARGVGVGEVLMDRVLEWAREQGCVGVDSLALPGNRHTKNFFESFGLVARAIVVHRPL
jgi:GNAT superfamily N-acetyltransferase